LRGVRVADCRYANESRGARCSPAFARVGPGPDTGLAVVTPGPMIEPIARGDGNAVQGAVLGRCLCTPCCAGRSAAPRERLSWRRAQLASAGVLQQPALPHHPPAELLAPTAVVLGASTLQSPRLHRSCESHPSQSGGEGRFHAAQRSFTRLAWPRGRSRRAARLRRFRLAEQHAVADDGGGQGKGQGRAAGMLELAEAVTISCIEPS